MSTVMRIPMTEYLEIDLETERWRCRRCGHDLGSARGNYKEGTLVYDRDPTEIHRPLIDPGRYEFTFAPDATCRRATLRPTTCRSTSTRCGPSGPRGRPAP